MPTESEYLELLHRVEQLERKVAALTKATPSHREHLTSTTLREKAEALVEQLGGSSLSWRLTREVDWFVISASVQLPGSADWKRLAVTLPRGVAVNSPEAWERVDTRITQFFEKGAAE